MREGLARKAIRGVTSILITCVAAGLNAQPPLAAGADAEISEDGLHRVDHSVMDAAWVKPNLNLAQYNEVYFYAPGVSFREVQDNNYRAGDRTETTEFPVSDESKRELRQLFRETFQADIADLDRYELTDTPGRDVLVVQGFLVDVVSHIPPDSSGNVSTNLGSTWEATIVLELRDSMSHEILARTVERERPQGIVDATDVWRETRQLIRRWSRLLCERIDEVSEISVL